MRGRSLRKLLMVTLVGVTGVMITLTVIPHQIAQSANPQQTKQKKLIDRAMEQDVEVEGVSEPHSEYQTFDDLAKDAVVIVYGRIIDSHSFFDPSGHPMEYGEVITTEYAVDVQRVLKDRTLISHSATAKPAPLTTPLKIARNGGEVLVNGHRASVKVKGFENFKNGQEYVFFLFWSPDYKAYVLAGGLSGVIIVKDDTSLRALASSKEIQARVQNLRLETLINQ